MSSVEIVPVTNKKQKRRFIDLPWQLYEDDPYWIPPLRRNQEELLNYRPHAFYEQAEIQTFIALREGTCCGRIAAIVNHAHNEVHNEKRGFFGFFECVDDEEVSDALFTAAWEWLAEKGMTAMRGPVNPSLNYECGLLVDGFDDSPYFMMTYNPPFYGRLIENFGCKKTQDLFAFVARIDMMDDIDEKHVSMYQAIKERFNIVTREVNQRRFQEEIELFLDIYNRSLCDTWGFVPMSKAEIQASAAGLRRLIVPELTLMAEIDGKPIGTVFGLLDYNPRIREIDGRLFPFGFWKLLRRRHEITRMRIISTNVLPEYQSWGVGFVVTAELLPRALKRGIQEGEFSWVLESNDLSRKTLEKGGAERSKTYRLYDYEPED